MIDSHMFILLSENWKIPEFLYIMLEYIQCLSVNIQIVAYGDYIYPTILDC